MEVKKTMSNNEVQKLQKYGNLRKLMSSKTTTQFGKIRKLNSIEIIFKISIDWVFFSYFCVKFQNSVF